MLEPCGQGAFLLETEVTELFELKSLHASTDRCPIIPSGRVPALLVTLLRHRVSTFCFKSLHLQGFDAMNAGSWCLRW